MQIFSPLMQPSNQSLAGPPDWNQGTESKSGKGFDTCFSESLAPDGNGNPGGGATDSTRQKADTGSSPSEENREDFSQAEAKEPASVQATVTDTQALQTDEHDRSGGKKMATLENGNEPSSSKKTGDKEEDARQSLLQLLSMLGQGLSEKTASSASERSRGISMDQAATDMLRLCRSLLEGTPGPEGREGRVTVAMVQELAGNKELLSKLRTLLDQADTPGMQEKNILSQMKAAGLTTEDISMLRKIIGGGTDTPGPQMRGETFAEGMPDTKRAAGRPTGAKEGGKTPSVQAKHPAGPDQGLDKEWTGLRDVLNKKTTVESSNMEQRGTDGKGTGSTQGIFAQHENERNGVGTDAGSRLFGDGEQGDGERRTPAGETGRFRDMSGSGDGRGSSGHKDASGRSGDTPARSDGLFSRTFLDPDPAGEKFSMQRKEVSRNVLDQVQRGAFRNLGQGRKQLTLKLNPADLGTVNVVLQVRGKDVNAVLKTNHEDTSRILGEQMTQLRDHLEKQGLRVVKLEVQNQMGTNERPDQWNGGSEHNQSKERFEANMRELRWRSLRGEGEGMAREMHIPDHEVNISPRGVDFFA
ncbi:flagellar hook-length control protein FliK [Desulfoplanes sp.]